MRRFLRLAAAVLAAVFFISGAARAQVGGQTPSTVAIPAAPMQTPAASQLNPTGTASTTYVMAGFGTAGGGNLTLTPRATGKVLVIISGTIQNSLINDGGQVTITYGTGVAPANGVAFSNGCSGVQCGTQVGAAPRVTEAVAGGLSSFATQAIITGMTIGTPYWFDLSQAAITGGTATVTNAGATIVELSP
jgi:hypothetical protein